MASLDNVRPLPPPRNLITRMIFVQRVGNTENESRAYNLFDTDVWGERLFQTAIKPGIENVHLILCTIFICLSIRIRVLRSLSCF